MKTMGIHNLQTGLVNCEYDLVGIGKDCSSVNFCISYVNTCI